MTRRRHRPRPRARPGARTARAVRHLWQAVAAAGGLAAVVLLLAGFLVLSGRWIELPPPLVARLEAAVAERLGPSLPPGTALRLEGLAAGLGRDGGPELRLQGMALLGPGGRPLLALPRTVVEVLPADLLAGRIRPGALRLEDGALRLSRDAAGRLGLSFAGGGAGLSWDGAAAALDALEAVLAAPILSGLARIDASGLAITFDDAATGGVWRLRGALLTLGQGAEERTARLEVTLDPPHGGPSAHGAITAAFRADSRAARLTAAVEGMSAGALAAEIPALAGLGLLDAPITAQATLAFDASGAPLPVEARLAIGAGALRPRPDLPPVTFARAEAALAFLPGEGRATLTDLLIDSRTLRLAGEGHVLPEPGGLVVQLRLTGIETDPEGLFAMPAAFAEGAIDARLRFDPFRIDVGELVLTGAGPAADGVARPSRLVASGFAEAGPGGWQVAADLAVDAIGHDRLLALWPLAIAPGTRGWLARNVRAGVLTEVRAGLRISPGAPPLSALAYDFDGAEVRVMPGLPPVSGARGYAVLDPATYSMVIEAGHLDPGAGGPIDVAGSVFRVPDVTEKPATAEITLRSDSSITAALALLDAPPFGFLARAGQPVDLAEGRAQLAARLSLPMREGVTGRDLRFAVEGTLSDVVSTRLVPGRRLAAERLSVTARARDSLEIAGRAELDGLPFEARWTLPLDPARPALPRLEGTAELSAPALATLGVALPQAGLEGAAPARFRIDFAPGAAPRFNLRSELAGLALALPDIAWRKPAAVRGRLEIEGRLGRPPEVGRIEFDAPGLSARGALALAPDGTLASARFERVRLDDWLDGPVELAGRGPGRPPAVTIRGGTVDLRATPLAAGAPAPPAGAGGRAALPVELALERLILTPGLALTDFRGRLTRDRGWSGQFTARLNGAAPVAGTVVPRAGRTGVRIRAEDAGAVFRAAGLHDGVQGGQLDLTLLPRTEGVGHDGELRVTGSLRLRKAPALAELLNAISVIGLIEQLDGQGIQFGLVEADFRLTPGGIEVTRASAVGPSMGISMSGVYDMAARRLDMRGTVSPFYMLNALGGVFAPRGEGLFGFNYRLAGPVEDPRVEVNPLSILTPGMFREIFRAPPPSLSQ